MITKPKPKKRWFSRSIRCQNCEKWFSLDAATIGLRLLPNTFTPLEDFNNPWVRCPRCGYDN